ncbi:MAG: NAD-binding protein [Candidatus Aminicenantes bacterium]|nr:NAD-binding protein [Candidatus Aminicenantes bacterium]
MNGKKRVWLSFLILVLVLISGVLGFKLLGGKEWSLLDSIYMTVITLSTVGYEEVQDLSSNPGARIFALVFIVLCLGTIAFAISSITAFIVEGELKNLLWRKKMNKAIDRLHDHYIVCGSDETARTVIEELRLTKKSFLIVEALKEKIEKMAGREEFLHIHGDPTEDSVLLSAGIKRAKGIVLSLESDEENLFVTLTARSLAPHIRIVTKSIDFRSQKKMIKAGADAVVSPTFIGGMRMVSEMIRPEVVTFLDMMLRDRQKNLRFEEVPVKKPGLAGKKVGECRYAEGENTLLVAVKKHGSKSYSFNPPKEMLLEEDDILILITGPEVIE